MAPVYHQPCTEKLLTRIFGSRYDSDSDTEPESNEVIKKNELIVVNLNKEIENEESIPLDLEKEPDENEELVPLDLEKERDENENEDEKPMPLYLEKEPDENENKESLSVDLNKEIEDKGNI